MTIERGDWDGMARAANEEATAPPDEDGSPRDPCPASARDCGDGLCGHHDCKECTPTSFCRECTELVEFCECDQSWAPGDEE